MFTQTEWRRSAAARRSLTLMFLVVLIPALVLEGCSSQQEFNVTETDVIALRELGSIYANAARKSKRAPRSVKELGITRRLRPDTAAMIESGELIVQWGAPVLPEGEASAVLAFIKQVPEEGGYVLLQDGTTVKRMTADEFKTAGTALAR